MFIINIAKRTDQRVLQCMYVWTCEYVCICMCIYVCVCLQISLGLIEAEHQMVLRRSYAVEFRISMIRSASPLPAGTDPRGNTESHSSTTQVCKDPNLNQKAWLFRVNSSTRPSQENTYIHVDISNCVIVKGVILFHLTPPPG